MAIILDSSTITPESIKTMPGEISYWAYCGLDCCVTTEVYSETYRQLTPADHRVYNFVRACNAPALEMMLRGVPVDLNERAKQLAKLEKEILWVQEVLDTLANAVWNQGLNPRSKPQLTAFFYETLGLPKIYISQKGEKKLSLNREALEKLRENFFAQPFVNCILKLRDLAKQRDVFKKGIDPDGRIRTSFNVGATETGRWSSSKNAFGTGDNLQNWNWAVRHILIADKGRIFANLDLEQAESRVVGLLAWLLTGQSNYLDACESGDLHTLTCKLIWPDRAWTGNDAEDKKLAEEIFYRTYSYRDMSKRGGHGSNYYGTPYTMARHLKVQVKLMEFFQQRYFAAFPEIPEWHQATATEIQTRGFNTTPFGRRRQYFGRLNDDATLREAIAQKPQSFVGDLLNLGLYRLWTHSRKWDINVLLNGHDAVLFDMPETKAAEIIPRVQRLLTIPFNVSGRFFTIPTEVKVGWNWGNYSEANPDGLKKWKGNETRTRQNHPTSSVLDRILC